jgi:penicillin-binding protein 1A
MAFLRRVLVVLLALGVLVGIAAAGGAYYFYRLIEADLPSLDRLEDYSPPLASVVLDRHGRRIGEFFDERRQITPVEEIPKHVVSAFVAAEDDTFFRHSGIDWISIVRAAWVNFSAGGKVKQGGSTITQQVAKSLVGSERSYIRKLKDMLLAKRIEERFTKDEILYLYLNQIYFGHGAYGVGEAARSYFGKKPAELSVSEAAMLAGLPKAPSDYSPTVSRRASEERRLYVLGRMYEQGFIDRAGYENAAAEVPWIRDPEEWADFAVAAGFTEEVRRMLYEKVGSGKTLRGGLVVETTLDLDLQRAAVLALQRGLESYDRRHGGWRGPERRVAASEIEPTAKELARQNGLVPLAAGQSTPPPPANRSLLGVVRSVDHDGARVLVAPDVEIELALPEATWAFRPKWKDDGSDSRGLDRLLHVGDVARFVLRPPPRPIGKPEAPAPSNVPPPPAEEEGEEGPEIETAGLPAVSSGSSTAEPLRFELHQVPEAQGGLLSLDVATGEVLAMVGGYDFARSEFNRVTQARRQPGSAFKAFLYGAAIENGWTPTSTVMDSPITLWDQGSMQYWSPKNYKNIYKGAVSMKEAIARSLNNAAIHVFLNTGIDPTIDFARRLGVRSPMGRHLSISLGSTEMSLVELVRAYGTFASGGRLLQPLYVRRVLARDGKVLLENVVLNELDAPPDVRPAATPQPTPAVAAASSAPAPALAAATGGAEAGAEEALFVLPSQGLPADEAFMMTYLLRQPVENPHGTAHKAAALGRPLAGKTGTTNEQNDAWFIGFSPEIVAGVWVGFDGKRMLGDKETGGRAALPIWIDYMNVALAKLPASDFPVPEGIEFRRVGGREVVVGGGEGEEEVVEEVRVTPVSWEPFITRQIARRQPAFGAGLDDEDEGGEADSSYDLLRDEAF